MPIDDATWDGHIRYAFEAQTPLSSLVDGDNELDFVVSMTGTMQSDNIYFDWFEIEYPKQFLASENQLSFFYDLGGVYKYSSNGFTNGIIDIFDITHPIIPTRVISPNITTNGSGLYTATFETTHGDNARFFIAAVGDEKVFKQPYSISYF